MLLLLPALLLSLPVMLLAQYSICGLLMCLKHAWDDYDYSSSL